MSLNHQRFDRPYHAFLAVFLQFISTLIIEVVNLWNLLTLTDIVDIIVDFLALQVLAEFDDIFIIPFLQGRLRVFAELEMPFRDYRKSKYIIQDKFVITEELFNSKDSFKECLEVIETLEPEA